MPVAEWLGEFLKRYTIRLGPHDWPTDPAEFREFRLGWVEVLDAIHATEAEAFAALVRLTAAAPPRFRSDHLPAVVAAIRALRREQVERDRVYTIPPIAQAEGPMTQEQRATFEAWLTRPPGDPLRRTARHVLGLEPDPGVVTGLARSLAKAHSSPPDLTPNPKG